MSRHRSNCPIARTLDVPTNILSDRLKRLVEPGLLERQPYRKHPVRYDYVPTETGHSVMGILRSMREFGEQHLCGRVPG